MLIFYWYFPVESVAFCATASGDLTKIRTRRLTTLENTTTTTTTANSKNNNFTNTALTLFPVNSINSNSISNSNRSRSYILTNQTTIRSTSGMVSAMSLTNLLPYFDFDVPRNVTVTVGQNGFLHCRVERLGDKDVSVLSII